MSHKWVILELKTLWLDGNKLSEIPSLGHLLKLETIRLSENNFKIIESLSFSDMNQLRHLYLNDLKHLVAIEESAFKNLPKLSDLDISGSKKLKFIHQNAFNNVPRLQFLNLAGNGLLSMSSNIPNSLPALKLLSLHHVSLPTVFYYHKLYFRIN